MSKQSYHLAKTIIPKGGLRRARGARRTRRGGLQACVIFASFAPFVVILFLRETEKREKRGQVYALSSEYFGCSSRPIGKYDWTVEYAVIRGISLGAAILMGMTFLTLEKPRNRIRCMFWAAVVLVAFWRAIPRL